MPGFSLAAFNMTESIVWTKRLLEALSGNGGLFISWQFSNYSAFDENVLFITLESIDSVCFK